MDVPFLFLRLTCLGQIYVLGEVSLSFIFGLCGPMLLAAPALPDTNPVISESPRKPLSVPEQAFCQSTSNASAHIPHKRWHPNCLPSFCRLCVQQFLFSNEPGSLWEAESSSHARAQRGNVSDFAET